MKRGASLAILVFAFGQLATAEEPKSSAEPRVDCGVSALFLLLRLEGREADLAALVESLPPRPAAGYSLKELRNEARRRGVPLRGVQLKSGERPEGPSIVFFGDGGHGHYVVARPVGHSGKLVQVLDPNFTPQVLDSEEFEARTLWTGLALVPDPPRWPGRIGIAAAAGGAACLGLVGWGRRSRRGDPAPQLRREPL